LNRSDANWFPTACTNYQFSIQAENACGHPGGIYTDVFRTRCATDPTVTTLAATDITHNAAILHKSVTANGATVSAQGFMYKEAIGDYWHVSLDGILTGLKPNTPYKFHAYARVDFGSDIVRQYNGEVLTFTTAVATAVNQGDINGDGQVDSIDLNILITNYGKSGDAISNPAADLNGDRQVDSIDLNILITNYGK